ncbi:Pyridine nucleotide-disulfide oxidoreductase domain-containing protein 2, partial [Characodon lateralis]|nr:Pyridine nucleotide-disulfide oxidoreductase domain-containing protein 2 [Characodon lateralis]
AVDKLPNFLASPTPDDKPGPQHQCSIHLNCENVDILEAAYKEAKNGRPSARPMVEMTIPSVLDPTLAPSGCHVVSLFTQFSPYHIEGKEWTEQDREAFADTVFDWVEQYAPGFKTSVVGRDILSPPDLERIFGLTGGNIFHGSMSLDQLYLARPLPSLSDYRSPLKGLYLCGSGCHPGGGVMGSPGWNAALTVISDLKHHRKI